MTLALEYLDEVDQEIDVFEVVWTLCNICIAIIEASLFGKSRIAFDMLIPASVKIEGV